MDTNRSRQAPAKPANPMARIEERLERLEQMLAPIAQVAEAAPAAIAVVSDTVDEWNREGGDADERLRRLARIVDRLTQPQTLTRLELMLEQLEHAPGFVAMLGDIVDDVARRAEAQGVRVDELVDNLRVGVLGAAKTAPVIAHVFDSGMLSEGAVQTLGAAARAIEAARAKAVRPVGLFGAVRALREPALQRALGFLVSVGRALGHELDAGDSQTKRLAAGE